MEVVCRSVRSEAAENLGASLMAPIKVVRKRVAAANARIARERPPYNGHEAQRQHASGGLDRYRCYTERTNVG